MFWAIRERNGKFKIRLLFIQSEIDFSKLFSPILNTYLSININQNIPLLMFQIMWIIMNWSPELMNFYIYEQILFLFFRNLQKNGLATQLVKVKLLSQLKNIIKEQHNMERRIISTKPCNMRNNHSCVHSNWNLTQEFALEIQNIFWFLSNGI